MSNLFIILIYFASFYFLNLYLIKKNFLLDQVSTSSHKSFLNKNKVPLSGGILFLTLFIFFIDTFNIFEKLIIISIFFLGLFSDTNKLKSPLLRLILQICILMSIIYISKIYILSTRLDFFDYFLTKYILISFGFTIFCLLVLINGSNFIDGINTLASGYFISVLLILIIYLQKINVGELFLILNDLSIILAFLIVFFVYNLFSKSFLGDGGSYLISLIIGLFLIKVSIILQNIVSPFFIALLLWYPSFENLFSIIRRKFYQRRKIKYADNLHLHHLLFSKLKKNFSDKVSNPLTGILINLVNFTFFLFGLSQINNSISLIILIIAKSIVYLSIYLYLRKNN